MKTTVSGRLLMLAAPLALVLSGCGDRAADPKPAAQAPTEAAAPTKPRDKDRKAPKRDYPADYAIDTPIAKGDIGTRLQVVGEPVYVAKDGLLEFVVDVTNTGKTAIVGAGKAPVNLAVNLVGPQGIDTAPGSRKFYRKRLPLIPEGSSGRVKVRLPAAEIAGLALRLELLQEGVSWWSRYKQPTLDLGPFRACADVAAGICDAAGVPLKTR